jgi:nucleoside-diphosphate-sugar epimerase
MRVLVVGGAGHVGRLVLPALAERHAVRVLDPKRPPDGPWEHHEADATDPAALAVATVGVDAVLHCAMGVTGNAASSFDVNVKSVYLTLHAAHEAGVRHAVHTSSMSVYRDLTARRLDESDPPDATALYGLTKRLGEEVCRAAVAEWGMSVNALRLVWPTADDAWPVWRYRGEEVLWRTPDGTPIHGTAGSDVARAVLAALDHRDGFQAFTISGDRSARLWSTEKARRVLGWTPTFGD